MGYADFWTPMAAALVWGTPTNDHRKHVKRLVWGWVQESGKHPHSLVTADLEEILVRIESDWRHACMPLTSKERTICRDALFAWADWIRTQDV